MRVLIACEMSGRVRDAFIAKGHDALSCDILPSERPGPHYQGDAIEVMRESGHWDLIIAHPPCQYLTNAGVRWLHTDPTRWDKLDAGAAFFRAMLDAPAPMVAVENPIMHKYAIERIGGIKQTQVIQPWMFGHPEKKATALWLNGLPPLVPVTDLRPQMATMDRRDTDRIHRMPPGTQRAKLRSMTFQGIADAMADQCGSPDAPQ